MQQLLAAITPAQATHPSGKLSVEITDRIAAVRDIIGPPENTADDGIQLFELLGEGMVS